MIVNNFILYLNRFALYPLSELYLNYGFSSRLFLFKIINIGIELKVNRLIIIIFIIASLGAAAQSDLIESSSIRYGIFSHYNYNQVIAGFKELPGIPNCCPSFDNGLGKGFSIGLLIDYELPFSLRTGLRAGISSSNNKLTKIEETLVRIGPDTGTGKFEHSIDASFLNLSFEPNITYNPVLNINLTVGASIGYMLTKNFHQEERIVEPADRGVFFETQTRVRNDSSGVLPKSNDIISFLFAGIGYELPLNREGSLMLVPEVYYYLGLSNFVKEVNWKNNLISAGISIVYSPKFSENLPAEKHQREEFIDTITVEAKEITKNKIITGTPKITSRIERTADTVYIIETSKRTDTSFIQPSLIAKLNYKEPDITLSVNYSKISFPVLPVLFYDKMSEQLDDYYIKLNDKNSFSIESLERNPLVFHKNILNIIGKRMELYPGTTIQLRGYVDFERENKDCNLALKRDEGIKNYLIKIWKIDERRIEILNGSQNCFPENVPSDKTDSAFAENRRVEILTPNPEILTSLVFKEPIDTVIEYTDKIDFELSESTRQGIAGLEIEGNQDGLQKFITNKNEMVLTDTQKINKEIISSVLAGYPLEVSLTIEDLNHRKATDKKKINFNKIIKENDKHIVFSILFGLADDRLNIKVKSELKNFVDKLDSAQVKITGYSDIIGGEKKNRMLSANRAKNSADLIRSINSKLDIISIKSYSYDKFPPGINSYFLPSERYFARTVVVEILRK